VEVSKVDPKKRRHEFKDFKLTHPKEEMQGKVWFIMLVSERTFAPGSPEANAALTPKQKPRKEANKKDEKEKEKKEKKEEKGTTRKKINSTEKRTIETKAGIGTPSFSLHPLSQHTTNPLI